MGTPWQRASFASNMAESGVYGPCSVNRLNCSEATGKQLCQNFGVHETCQLSQKPLGSQWLDINGNQGI